MKELSITEDDIYQEISELSLPHIDAATRRKLETTGLMIEGGFDNWEVEFCKPEQYFFYKRRPVLVYIKDQFVTRDRYRQGKHNPFHICYCDALKEAEQKHRLQNRYVLTYNTSGEFQVHVTVRDGVGDYGYFHETSREDLGEQTVRLRVCNDCLRALNWKKFRAYCGDGPAWWQGGDRRMREKIVREFSIEEFLGVVRKRTFDDDIVYQAAPVVVRKKYHLTPEDKEKIKRIRHYRCAKCQQVFAPGDLQIHHVDHNEGNNCMDNLMVVCEACHQAIHEKEGGVQQEMREAWNRMHGRP